MGSRRKMANLDELVEVWHDKIAGTVVIKVS